MKLEYYFPFPLASFNNKELLPALKKSIHKQKIKGIESNCAPHLKKNLVESKFDFLNNDDIAIVKTKYFIGESIGTLLNTLHSEDNGYQISFVDSWFHIGKTNSVHEAHIHSNSSWCGIYYVETGDTKSGATHFRNPAYSTYVDAGSRWLKTETIIKPENGLLILFPSHLEHYQSLYTGKKNRIVVAFNAQIQFIDNN